MSGARSTMAPPSPAAPPLRERGAAGGALAQALRAALPGAPLAWPAAAQRPAELDRRSLLELHAQFQRVLAAGGAAADWATLPPLVPGIADKADLLPLDRRIERDLGALEAVAQRPRSHLTHEIERMPAGRARRLPARAAAHLAAHTEDWERPTLGGIRPLRLLAEQREELMDLYENRVAARLIDHLERHLLRRLAEVTGLLRVFGDLRDARDEATQGSHWRRRRLCSLWGEALDVRAGDERARRTRFRLSALRRRVLALKATPLYRAVPPRAQVGATLRMTNIFTSDPLYRRVAGLYRAWSAAEPARDEDELRAEEARQAEGFSGFCALLFLRALEQLGFAPGPGATLGPGQALRLLDRDKVRGEVTLRWRAAGQPGEPPAELVVEGAGQALRFRPLPILLARTEPAARPALEQQLGEVLAEGPLLLLAPESRRAEDAVLDGPWDGGGARVVSVSPWDLGSVERVARALQPLLLGQRLLAYPPEVTAPPPEMEALRGFRQDRGGWRLLMPPEASAVAAAERRRSELEARVTSLSEALEQARAVRQTEARKGGAALGEANRRKSLAEQELKEAQEEQARVVAFGESLRAARGALRALLRCPVCGKGEARLEPRDGVDLECRCPCGARWGTRSCRCGKRFATLWPGVRLPPTDEEQEGEGRGDWVERLVGRDVLAAPCPTPHGDEPRFLCSRCRSCPDCAGISAAEDPP